MKKTFLKPLLKKASFFGKFFWERLYLYLILFLALDILIGVVLFSQYYLKPAAALPATNGLVSLNYTLLDKAVDYWSSGQKVIDTLEQKQYPNLFR